MFASLCPPWLAWPALIGLATALPMGAGAWLLARYEDAAARSHLDQAAAQAAQSLTLRLRECDTKMLALASWLDRAGPVADDASWQLLEKRLQIGRSGACAGTVAFLQLLAPSELAAHEAAQSARLGRPYQVRPPGQRPWYTPIIRVAPVSEYTSRMLGLDPGNDPRRRESLERARDSGRPSVTGRVHLRMINDPSIAVIMHVPVFRQGLPLDTVAQRRSALFGFVAQPLMIDAVVAATAAEHPGLQLLLRDPLDPPAAALPVEGPAVEKALRFGERDWTLIARTAPGQLAGDSWRASTVWLLAGLLLTGLAVIASALLLRQRARAYSLARRFSRKARLNATGLRAVLEGARDGILQLGVSGRVLAVNRAAEHMVGRSDLVGLPATELFAPDDRDHAVGLFRDAVRQGRRSEPSPPRELILRHADGRPLPVRCSISRAVVHERETMIWLIGDTSREEALEKQAAAAERLNALLLDAVPSALLLVDGDGHVVRCNPSACDLFGYPEENLVGLHMMRLHVATEVAERLAEAGTAQALGPDLFRSRRDADGRLVAVEWTLQCRDGSLIPVSMLAVAVNAATSPQDARRADSTLVLINNESERKRATAQIERLALHDSLTSLPNRLQLEERARHALQHAQQHGKGLALALLDLDRFKQINDTLGHPVGDRLLQTVARCLSESVRSGDTVARMGGDEFVLLLVDVNTPVEAMRAVEKVCDAFRGNDFAVEGHHLRVTFSVGVALCPAHGSDLAGLLRHADLAMYRAKAAGRDTALLFDPERHAANAARLRLETDLRRALAAGELVLHYQPVVNTASGSVSALEALLRWQHPALGLIPPGDFIGIAEDTGEIAAIGAWALRRACADLAGLRERWPELRVAVNVSARQLLSHDLVGDVQAALAQAALPGSALELELTESALVETHDHVLHKFDRLRELGVGIAIDDFGTGYSSLAYLAGFPVSTLKVDRRFVSQIDSGQGHGTLAAAIVSLARGLGLETVAEGVESTAQWTYLHETGCLFMQGYLFSPAVPPERLPETMARIAAVAPPEPQQRLELWQRSGYG